MVTAGTFQGVSMKVVSYLNILSRALKIIALTVLFHHMDSVHDEMLCNYLFKRTVLFWV